MSRFTAVNAFLLEDSTQLCFDIPGFPALDERVELAPVADKAVPTTVMMFSLHLNDERVPVWSSQARLVMYSKDRKLREGLRSHLE